MIFYPLKEVFVTDLIFGSLCQLLVSLRFLRKNFECLAQLLILIANVTAKFENGPLESTFDARCCSWQNYSSSLQPYFKLQLHQMSNDYVKLTPALVSYEHVAVQESFQLFAQLISLVKVSLLCLRLIHVFVAFLIILSNLNYSCQILAYYYQPQRHEHSAALRRTYCSHLQVYLHSSDKPRSEMIFSEDSLNNYLSEYATFRLYCSEYSKFLHQSSHGALLSSLARLYKAFLTYPFESAGYQSFIFGLIILNQLHFSTTRNLT